MRPMTKGIKVTSCVAGILALICIASFLIPSAPIDCLRISPSDFQLICRQCQR